MWVLREWACGVLLALAGHSSGKRVSQACENRGGEQAGVVTTLILLQLQHQTPIRFQQLGQTLDAFVPPTPSLTSWSAPAGACNPPLSVPLSLNHTGSTSALSAWQALEHSRSAPSVKPHTRQTRHTAIPARVLFCLPSPMPARISSSASCTAHFIRGWRLRDAINGPPPPSSCPPAGPPAPVAAAKGPPAVPTVAVLPVLPVLLLLLV